MQTPKLKTIGLIGLTMLGAQIPGILTSGNPAQSTDCNSSWIGKAFNDAQQAIAPSDGGISQGERQQMGEVFHVPASQLRVAEPKAQPQAVAPEAIAPQAAIAPPATAGSTPMPPTSRAYAAAPQAADSSEEALDRQIATANGMSYEQYKAHPEKADPLAGMNNQPPEIRSNGNRSL